MVVTASAQSGFRLGSWNVYPNQNRLQGPDGEAVLEPKVMDVLVRLASEPGEVVSRQELLDSVWAGTVVGDEVVSRAISVLRAHLGDSQKEPRYLKTISKRGYCLIADVLPLDHPDSRVESPTQAADAPSATTQPAPRQWKFNASARRPVLVAVLVLALAFVVFQQLSPRDSSGGDSRDADLSIAVLPFVNMSDDAGNDYFSDGISEELLNHLSRVPELRVISRTSSFSLRAQDLDIPTVAERLNVSFVLEGSVRKAGDVVRITAQLIDAHADSHIWSEVYERDLENVFGIQDEISAAIVGSIHKHLGVADVAIPQSRIAANVEAQEAYLRARYLMRQATYATTDAAIREFESALSLDPEFAPAHAELAMAYPYRIDNLELVQHHVNRAMALDPELAETHAAAGVAQWREEKWHEALASFRRAVKVNPNYVIAYVHMGNLLSWKLGRYSEAFEARSIAMQLDPLSVPTIVYYLQGLIERGRFDEANEILEKIRPLFPHVYAYRQGSLLSVGGEVSHAVFGSLEALKIDPTFTYVNGGLAFRLARLGLGEEALSAMEDPLPLLASYLGNAGLAIDIATERLAANPASVAARHDLGLALAGAGEFERATPYLEEAWRRSGGRISKRSDVFQTMSALALIAARRQGGNEAGVGELVDAIHDNVRRYRDAGIVGDGRSYGPDFEEGLALYFSGDYENGLAGIARGMQAGVFLPPGQAYLAPLYSDPEFAPARARQDRQRMQERTKVLDRLCTDNPYATVWQPAEGTCRRFAANDN